MVSLCLSNLSIQSSVKLLVINGLKKLLKLPNHSLNSVIVVMNKRIRKNSLPSFQLLVLKLPLTLLMVSLALLKMDVPTVKPVLTTQKVNFATLIPTFNIMAVVLSNSLGTTTMLISLNNSMVMIVYSEILPF